MLKFQICYHSNLNVSQKTKTNKKFRGQAWVRPSAKCWVKGFVLPHKYHVPNFYQRFWYALTKNTKTNNNIAGYHLVSRPVISVPSDVQRVYRCPNRTFILPKNYHVSVKNMLSQVLQCVIKNKTNTIFENKPGNDPPQSVWSRTLSYPVSIYHAPNFY